MHHLLSHEYAAALQAERQIDAARHRRAAELAGRPRRRRLALTLRLPSRLRPRTA